MDASSMEVCETCSTLLPQSGYFCGKCLTQFKCKNCDSSLEKEFAGCIMCGTPRQDTAVLPNKTTVNSNSFRVHETKEERTIEASFSDVVGKDIASILRDAATNGMRRVSSGLADQKGVQEPNPEIEDAEAQVLDNNHNVDRAQTQKQAQDQSVEYPTIRAVAMKKLPASEPEWVIVYAFYASNFGKDTFTRQQIIEKYKESGRTSDYASNRLAQNLTRTVQSGYLNPLTDEFSILDLGIQKAVEIINRTTSATSRVKSIGKKASKEDVSEDSSSTSKKSTPKPKGLKKLNNINFEPEGKESLKSYYEKYSLKSDQERNLLFINYLRNILELDIVGFDHLYTCYDILDLKVSENLPQTVRNTASRTGWIEIKDSIISLTIRGSNQIKDWNKGLNK